MGNKKPRFRLSKLGKKGRALKAYNRALGKKKKSPPQLRKGVIKKKMGGRTMVHNNMGSEKFPKINPKDPGETDRLKRERRMEHRSMADRGEGGKGQEVFDTKTIKKKEEGKVRNKIRTGWGNRFF